MFFAGLHRSEESENEDEDDDDDDNPLVYDGGLTLRCSFDRRRALKALQELHP